MRFRTTIKTLVRSPLKSLLTLLLLTATTFAFVSRGVEYVATVQQIKAAESTYFATGTVERTLSGYENEMYERLGDAVYELEDGNYLGRTDRAVLPLEHEVADTILSSKYIEKSEVRLVSGGTHSEYRSVIEQPLTDLRNYNSWWDVFAPAGTLAMSVGLYTTDESVKIGYNHALFTYTIDEVKVGYAPELYRRNMQIGAFDPTADYEEENLSYYDSMKEDGCVYLVTARLWGWKNTTGYLNTLVNLPMVNLTRLKQDFGENVDVADAIRNPTKYGLTEYVNTEGNPTVNLLDYYATVERNLHTSEVVYTSDIDLIHKFKSGDMFISDGRALEENEQAEVCIIGADFAELNGLSVGDTITLDLCADTMVHSGKVFGRETPYPTDRDVVSENQLTERNLPNVTKTFEIVGIWSDANFDVEDPYTYALNTIFVPEACYPWPGQVEPSLLPSTFSFELKHPGDAALIKAELGDQLAELGYELKINDGGYAAAKPNLEFMRLSALIGFVAMCVGLALCLILITYLFIIRKKKDYAIMRALGTTKARSNRALLSALLTLALVAVTIGAFIAGFAAQTAAAKAAAEVAELTGVEATGVGSWEFTIAFAVGTLGLVFTFAKAGLIKISRTPPLALLQGR